MSRYETQARRVQLALTQSFQRAAPYEFDAVFDLQRMICHLSIADPTWKAFEQQRLMANDAAAFIMEILENLWSHAGFQVAYLPQAVPHEHALYLRCGLQVDTAMCVSNIPSATDRWGELNYSQFVGLDVFRLLYDAPNPLPVLNDHQLQLAAGDFDVFSSYLYGVLLLNHPWTLTEKARVNLNETPYPWRTVVEVLADSHLRYHFPEELSSESAEALHRLFRSCVFPPVGYQGDAHGNTVARNVLDQYFDSCENEREALRRAFQRLAHSPNPRLQALGQVMNFALGSEEERQLEPSSVRKFQQQLLEGQIMLVRDFDFLVNDLGPLFSKRKLKVPKPDTLNLLPGV